MQGVCIIRSSVCSVYVSYAAEARGRRMLAANYNRGAAFSLFIIFVISFYWSLCWIFGKFHTFSTLRFLFAQLVSRRFDSETVTRMTQGSLNPAARCTLSEGLAARRLSRKWHTFIILATLWSLLSSNDIPLWIPLYHSLLKDTGRKRLFWNLSKVWISSLNLLLSTAGLQIVKIADSQGGRSCLMFFKPELT